MTIAFTGATGHLGQLVADALLTREEAGNIVALARDPQKASDLAAKGIQVRAFDYAQPDGLAAALDGVDRLLLISGTEFGQRVAQHQAVIDAATQAGVGFLAYTSFLHADDAPLIAVAPEHVETEKLLADAPFPVALLRNGWYTENYEDAARQAAESGVLLGATGGGRISSAARRDYADAAAAVLTGDPTAATYELAGDRSWSLDDLAAAITTASGTPVQAKDVSADELRTALTGAGLPAPLIDFLVGTDQAIAAGELEDPNPGELSRLIGRPTTPLSETVAGWFA
ncbi:MAG: SDR family oxidoreductase [Gordonia sp. (in: high G+C Gram-positive bacteria)]|uniref:SDR family oxidoreductase n=1 Tax=Gordonia sp. (in: high G+C Gram-positive bacteria) TaxID=84139 RepID=UPI0039E63032